MYYKASVLPKHPPLFTWNGSVLSPKAFTGRDPTSLAAPLIRENEYSQVMSVMATEALSVMLVVLCLEKKVMNVLTCHINKASYQFHCMQTEGLMEEEVMGFANW